MHHPNQDVRASTMAISQSIKFRKNCLLEASPSRFNHQKPSFMDQENIQPLFYKDSKSLNGSIQVKRENRRKAGSIVKIVRNFKSQEKDLFDLSRKQLGDGNNYLNSKLQFDGNNEESIGVYRKHYEQNKVLNEALRSKIYQSNEKNHSTNSLIGLSNFSYNNQENQFSRKIYSPNQDILRTATNNQQHSFNSKYQKILEDHDKKKNFIKEQMQAMKQKSSLQNFSTYDRVMGQQGMSHHCFGNSLKDEPLQRSKYSALDQKLKTIQDNSSFKGSYSDKKDQFKTHGSGFRARQTIESEKEDEIDKKFRAYQSKLQKHKDFEKRNPSIGRKDLNQPSIDKVVNNLALSTKTELFQTKNHGNETLEVFIDLIGKQIQKDEQVRVLKHNLKHVPIAQIESVLKQKFEIFAYPQNFKLSTEEYDPFFELQKSQIPIQQTIRKLIAAIQIAENFWKNLIKGRLNSNDLEQVYDALNFGKKDEIVMNELARELSFHLGKTIRNKEIYLVYQRLTPLTRQNFINKLEAPITEHQ